MSATLTAKIHTNGFSAEDFKLALSSAGVEGNVLSAKPAKNGVYSVRFKTLVGVAGCRFIGEKALYRAKIQRMSDRRKQVQFRSFENGTGITSNGHVVTLDHCACKSYRDDVYSIDVAGERTCKHQMQLAHVYFGAMTIRDLVEVRRTREIKG